MLHAGRLLPMPPKTSGPVTDDVNDSAPDPLLNSLRQESDRGCVLVSAAFIDQALDLAIRADFSPSSDGQATAVRTLFSSRGPLGRMWARLQYARARDIIDEDMFEAIERVRSVRNRFAHGYEHVAFDDVLVRPEVDALRKYAISWSSGEPDLHHFVKCLEPIQNAADTRRIHREIFEGTVLYIVGRLHGRAEAHTRSPKPGQALPK